MLILVSGLCSCPKYEFLAFKFEYVNYRNRMSMQFPLTRTETHNTGKITPADPEKLRSISYYVEIL
jgi:hypothetical protein